MDQLPAECREHFLLYLMPEDIGTFSLVSKWWFESLKDEILWKNVYLRAFGGSKPSDSGWREVCTNSFAALYAVMKDGERYLSALENSSVRYKKLADFILGGNYTQEELQGLCRLTTLPAILGHVAKAGHGAILKRLAMHLPPRMVRSQLLSIFLKSSEGGHVEQLEWAVALDPNLDVNNIFQLPSGESVTALLVACQSNSLGAVRFLLKKAAKITVVSREISLTPGRRRTWKIINVPCPVSHAISHGFTPMVKLFINHIAESNAPKAEKTRTLQGYLEQAVRNNLTDVVDYLLEKKEYVDINGMTGLSSSDGVAISLVQPNDETEKTLRLSAVGPAIFHAVMQGHIEMTRLLINKGADVNVRTTQRRTALHVSSYYGTLDCAKLLLDNGAEVDTKTSEGATPLSVASWKGHKAIMEVLQQELAKRKGKG